jgi:hypothetical protein
MKKAAIKSHFARYRLRYSLTVIFLIGLLGVGYFRHERMEYLEHLSMAVSISGFIAFFMEVALHQEFAKNVFEASLGFLLPEEMKGELRWIYNQPLICEDMDVKITLLPLKNSGGLLLQEVELVRALRNVTGDTHKYQPGLWVEDNLHVGHPSSHKLISCQVEGEPKSPNYADQLEVKRHGLRVTSDEKRVPKYKVKRGGKVTATSIYTKTVREQDYEYLHFGAPTTKVTVTVNAPANLTVDVFFSHRDGDPEFTHPTPSVWKLDGVLLPLQGIRVVWFRTADFQVWKKDVAGPVIA